MIFFPKHYVSDYEQAKPEVEVGEDACEWRRGGVCLKWGMCDTSPEEAGLSPRGWWSLLTESNEADEKAIYGITFHLHFVRPLDQKTILIWRLHQ